MAQQTTVALIDDIDGSKGSETVQFGLDGAHLEIDLNAKNAKALRKALAEFVAAARTVKPSVIATGRIGSAAGTRKKAPAARNTTDKETLVKVRAWAQESGLQVAARGRIAADVFAQYDAAHTAA